MFFVVLVVLVLTLQATLKKYQRNTGTVACNLCFNVPETYLQISSIKETNSSLHPQLLLKLLKSFKKSDFLMVCPPDFTTLLWH